MWLSLYSAPHHCPGPMIMKKRHLLLCLVLPCLIPSGRASAHVTLDNPLGGEVYVVGSTVTIKWHVEVEHDQQDWDLYFSTNGGATWERIELNLPIVQNTYQWVVPNRVTMRAQIRIVMDNQLNTDYDARSGDFTIEAIGTAIEEAGEPPERFGLSPGFPNPFRTSATIAFALPRTGPVVLAVFDLAGRNVETLEDGILPAGRYRVRWSASGLSGGVYLYRLTAGGHTETRMLVHLR